MVLQCAALIAIFVVLGLQDPDANLGFLGRLRDGLIYAMLGATALSGLQYLWRAAGLLREEPPV
jgi:hypothetical protein